MKEEKEKIRNKVLREIITNEICYLNKEGLLRILESIYDLKNRYSTTNIKGKLKIYNKE